MVNNMSTRWVSSKSVNFTSGAIRTAAKPSSKGRKMAASVGIKNPQELAQK